MSISEYVTQQKAIQKSLLDYIEHEGNDKSYYDNLIKLLDNPSIRKAKSELSTTLRLIADVSNNYHRTPDFFHKIFQIILFFKDDIKQTFTNLQILKIFRKNKQVILFLIKEQILIPDKSVVEKISYENYKKKFFPCFFYPELKNFMDDKLLREVEPKINDINKNGPNAFEQFREIGENNEQICDLIRKDSLDEFTSHVKANNVSLSKTIEPSVFETNSFLLHRIPTLIEYSAFYGSLKIFNYLLQNNVQLTGSVWLYAIHSKNMELIHLLEEKNVQPQDPTFNECLVKAIKCHHNDIADYIKSHFIKDQSLNTRVNSQIIGSRNYHYFPEDLSKSNEFYDLCKYNYTTIVDMLLTNVANIDVNVRVVFFFFVNSYKVFFCYIFNRIP